MAKETFDYGDEYFKLLADEFNAKGASNLNDEGAINLAEAILSEIRIEMKHVIAANRISPNSLEVRGAVKGMDDLLGSVYFNTLTMGHGEVVHDYFRRKVGIETEVTKIG